MMKRYLILSLVLFSLCSLTNCSSGEFEQNSKIKDNENIMENFKQKAEIQGTPITSENIVDVLEIQRVIDAQVDAYDTQQWELARSLMAEEFETNIGQESTGMMKSDDFLDRAKGYHATLEEFVTHHSNSGYRIFFHDKNNVTAFARGVIIV